MYPVAIVTSRHRKNPMMPSPDQNGSYGTADELKQLVDRLQDEHPGLVVVGLGSDKDNASVLRDYCRVHNIPYVEPVVVFENIPPNSAVLHLWFLCGRYAYITDTCKEVHAFVSATRLSFLEDLITRARDCNIPVTIYEPEGN